MPALIKLQQQVLVRRDGSLKKMHEPLHPEPHPDELGWGAVLVASVWMTRWSVFCAWLFLAQTLAAVVASPESESSDDEVARWNALNGAFNLIYTVAYLSFMASYAVADEAHAPLRSYCLGVLSYLCGYACFFALYSIELSNECQLHPIRFCTYSVELADGLYLAGSVLFTFGSALLVYSTWPTLIHISPIDQVPACAVSWICMHAFIS